MLHFFNKEYKIFNDITGDFNLGHNTIRCFIYQFEKDYFKIRVLSTILHELRHKYQSVFFKDKFMKDHENYIHDGEGYIDQWIEKDARKFSKRVMNLYQKDINKIIKFNNDWKLYK